jgi:hypothetical protein
VRRRVPLLLGGREEVAPARERLAKRFDALVTTAVAKGRGLGTTGVRA